MRARGRGKHVPAIVLALSPLLGACAAAGDRPSDLDAAIASLAVGAARWAWELRGVAIVLGTLRVPESTLAALADPGVPDGRDMYGNRFWYARCSLADAESLRGDCSKLAEGSLADIGLYVHEHQLEEALQQLRRANGQPVWLIDQGVWSVEDLHVRATTEHALHAVCVLFDAPLSALADGVARRDPRIEQLFADLRARRLDAQQVVDRIEPWDQRALPALLAVMVDALQAPRAGDSLASGHARIAGYTMAPTSTFDVACLASQALRDFLTQAAEDDAARTAEVRALAVWLRLFALGAIPTGTGFRRRE